MRWLLVLVLTTTISKAQQFKSVNEVKGLNIGDIAPSFVATDVEGKTYSLKDALENNPVVVIFYRGQWCPVCNRYLSSIEDSLQFIYDKRATVVAISPEKSEFLKYTKEKTHASFTLLYDKDYVIGDAFDVTFLPDIQLINKYNTKLNAELQSAHSDSTARLPVPATFIINRQGVIVWRQFNRDYKIRASVKEIVSHLPTN